MPETDEFSEPEITAAVDLCRADGALNPAAIGWSRHPLHRCNLSGHWPRKKRWDFWAVTSDTHMLRLTYGCTDYLGVAVASWLDYRVGSRVEHSRIIPLARGMRFPKTVGGADIRFESRDLSLAMLEEAEGTRLQAMFRRRDGRSLDADVLVARPPGHETLNVVIPWSVHSFQFTSKQNTRPAVGSVTLDGETFMFNHTNQAFGCLDFGRGVWPFQTVWNWGAASGWQDGRTIGLNLGGKWTDGTGMTESGICIGGRLHKISEPLIWSYDRRSHSRPWRIRAPRSGRVDLEFVPMIEEAEKIELGVVGTELHWVLGHYNGAVIRDDGLIVEIGGLLGWAEEHTARW